MAKAKAAKAAKTPMKKAKAPMKAVKKATKKSPAKKGASPKKQAKEQASTPASKLKRRLSRRDTDDQIERAIGTRFDHIDNWESKVDEDGRSIKDYVEDEVRRTTNLGKYIRNDFWTKIWAKFDLATTAAMLLVDPPMDQDIDEDLMDAISVAHSCNPCGNVERPLERYLSHCAPLSRRNLFGLLNSIEECPDLPRPLAVKCQIATLWYFARTGQHKLAEFEDYWMVIKDQLAWSLKYTAEEAAETGVKLKSFVRCNEDIITLFHDFARVWNITLHSEDADISDISEDISITVSEGIVGAALCKELWIKAATLA